MERLSAEGSPTWSSASHGRHGSAVVASATRRAGSDGLREFIPYGSVVRARRARVGPDGKELPGPWGLRNGAALRPHVQAARA